LDGKSFFLALFNSHLSTWLGFDASGLILGFPFLPSMIEVLMDFLPHKLQEVP